MAETSNVRSRDEILSRFHRAFLTTVGYTAGQVASFGDLEKMPAKELQELLHRKTQEAHLFLVKKKPKIMVLTRKSKRRRKPAR